MQTGAYSPTATLAFREAVDAEVQRHAEQVAAALALMAEQPRGNSFLLPDGKRMFFKDTVQAPLYSTVTYTPRAQTAKSYTPKKGRCP